MKSESTDDLNSELPVGENDVVESDKECSNVVCLSEMSIELFGEVLEDGLSDSSLCKARRVGEDASEEERRGGDGREVEVLPTRIGDSYGEELLENLADDLDGVSGSLVADGIPSEEHTAGCRCSLSNLR